jgi:AcrR family transcriptional regulator
MSRPVAPPGDAGRPVSRRQAQADETRRLVLDAALRLFSRDGYAATSVADIAREAGVALPTVYASVGSKPTLLRLLVDRVDERAGIPELHARAMAATTAAEVLAVGVRLTRRLAERCGDVLAAVNSAATADHDLAALVAEGDRRHREGAAGLVRRMEALDGLAAGMTAERAGTVLDVLTQPEMFDWLVGRHGWSYDQAEEWLLEVLSAQLLRPTRGGRGRAASRGTG